MKRPQASILAIILLVAVCAMTFTALQTGSKLWYSALYTFTAFLLLFAVLAARFRRGPERAFWFGFAVFGWGFFLMGLGPWMNPFVDPNDPTGHSLNPNLLTSKVIYFLVPYLRKDPNALGAIDEITENTIGIAHLLMSLIIAITGGIIAALLRRRPRSTTSIKSMAILAGLALITAVAASIYSPRPRDPVFPKSVFKNASDFRLNWYSEQLCAMGEPPLLALSRRDRVATVYRLLWLPSFHHSVCVRIDQTGEGARLRARVLDGRGGYDPGQIAIDRNMTVAGDQWNELDRLLQQAAFWELPTELESDGGICDGDQLIVEGLRAGKYHVVDRVLADPAYVALCHYMLKLTRIDMGETWAEYHPIELSAEPE
jgi:hypothetical protein